MKIYFQKPLAMVWIFVSLHNFLKFDLFQGLVFSLFIFKW